MKRQALAALGINEDCLDEAQNAIQVAGQAGRFQNDTPQIIFQKILATPADYHDDSHFGSFARKLSCPPTPALPESKATFQQWGQEIDQATIDQMKLACSVPVSVAGAIMPDGQGGYFDIQLPKATTE